MPSPLTLVSGYPTGVPATGSWSHPVPASAGAMTHVIGARSLRDATVVDPAYWASNLVKPLATRARTSAPPALVSVVASGSLTAHT